MIRRALLALVVASSGCGSDDLPNAGAAGSSGAGGTGSSTDAAKDSPAIDDVSDGAMPEAPITVLVDEIFGGTSIDPPSSAKVSLPLHQRPSSQWPLFYSFDMGVDGWETTSLSHETPLLASIAHGDEDFKGDPASGSLAVRWMFEPYAADASPYGARARAFSAASGPPRNWKGYRIAARAKTTAGTRCPTSANLYVLAGPEQKYVGSNHVWLSRSEWRAIEFDLTKLEGLGDLTQITEFGVAISRDICAPPT